MKIELLRIGIFAISVCAVLAIDAFPQSTLKELFADDFLIGASMNRNQFSESDKTGASIVSREFNTISPENELKWESVHPSLGRYDFRYSDKFVEFGEKNGMAVIGHTLIWHNQTPAEVFSDEKGKNVTRKTLIGRMRNHIYTVVGRYKGRIKGWDVVNEALNEDGSLRKSKWLEIIGEDFIELAFRFAREADPNAELYYNDYSLENTPKRRGAVRIVRNLLRKGVRVDGIGSQGHNDLSFPTRDQLNETIKEFSALGVQVMITELDINVLPHPEGFSGAEVTLSFENRKKLDPFVKGLPKEIEKKQSDRYLEIFDVLRDNRDSISRVTFWNVTDRDSWLNNFPVRGRTNYPLLFDRQGNRKPSYSALMNRFKKHSKP